MEYSGTKTAAQLSFFFTSRPKLLLCCFNHSPFLMKFQPEDELKGEMKNIKKNNFNNFDIIINIYGIYGVLLLIFMVLIIKRLI